MTRMPGWRVWSVAAAVLSTLAVLAPREAGAAAGPVDELATRILAATSIEQAEQAIHAAKLPPGDAAALRAKLKEPAVAAHLRRLAAQAAKATAALADQRGKQRSAELNARAKEALAAKNREVQSQLARLTMGGLKHPTPTARMTPVAAQTLLAARSFRPGGDNPATITSVSATPVVVGGQVTIRRRGLGGSQARVDLLFEALRLSVACTGVSGSDTQVRATVPAGVEALVDSSGEEVIFWLKPPGHDLGPNYATRLVSSDVPTITGTSDEAIEPGQVLIVEGTGFGTGRGRARVQFPSLGQTRDAIVDSWADTAVVVHLDELLSGLPREVGCELELTTRGGRSASRRLTFQAALVYSTLTEVLERESSSCGWTYYTENAFLRETLRNGWQVYAEEVRLESNPGWTRCEVGERAPIGSDSPMMSVRVGINAEGCYSTSARCSALAVICGPRGTWYRGGSVVPPT